MSTHPRGSWCRARYVSLVRKTQRFLLFELFLERQPKQFAADPSRKVFDERAPQVEELLYKEKAPDAEASAGTGIGGEWRQRPFVPAALRGTRWGGAPA